MFRWYGAWCPKSLQIFALWFYVIDAPVPLWISLLQGWIPRAYVCILLEQIRFVHWLLWPVFNKFCLLITPNYFNAPVFSWYLFKWNVQSPIATSFVIKLLPPSTSFRSQYLPLGWQILDRNRRLLPTRRSQNTFSISDLSPFSIAQPLLFYICPRRKMWRVKRVKDLWLRGLNSTQRNLETISRLSLNHSHI